MEIKLAEYKDGKFERFLELGKDFLFGGDFIALTEKMTLLGVWGFGEQISFKKDQKDPLNRFDGLFDGRTFGEGRFVLIHQAGDFYEDSIIDDGLCGSYSVDIKLLEWGRNGGFVNQNSGELLSLDGSKYLGNIHQNPEMLSGQRINFNVVL